MQVKKENEEKEINYPQTKPTSCSLGIICMD